MHLLDDWFVEEHPEGVAALRRGRSTSSMPVALGDEYRAVLATLRTQLWSIGSANDAQDHGSGDEAERIRKDSCAAILGLLARHPFIADLFPTLEDQIDNGRILGIGWAQLSDRLDAYVKESEGGAGKG